VIPGFECRSVFDTSSSGTPAASMSVAARCRRSCSRTRGSSALTDLDCLDSAGLTILFLHTVAPQCLSSPLTIAGLTQVVPVHITEP
jgi:hypothetical protein